MQKKNRKSLNPEITEEDLAVKAFDNLDAIVEKSDKAVEREFLDLVKNCFGNLYVDEKNNSYYKKLSKTNKLEDLTLYKSGWWLEPLRAATLEIDLPEQIIKSDAGETVKTRRFVENKKYNPIKITAYTKKALNHAKKFAVDYQKLSGQKVRIIQDFAEEKLEEKVENTEFKTLKVMGGKARRFASQTGKFLLVPFYLPTALRKGTTEKESETYLKFWGELSTEAEGAALLIPLTIVLTQAPIMIGLCSLTDNSWPLALYPVTNSISGLYEWYRYEKNKIVGK